MSLKSELKAELKSRNIKFKNFNKRSNKTAKEEILGRLVRRGIVEGYSKEKLAKELRSIQINKKKLTFSNELVRTLYDRSAVNARKVNPAKLRSSAKPRADKIKKTKRKSGKALGAYFYICRIYLNKKQKDKTRGKRVPNNRNVLKVTNDKTYIASDDMVFVSEKILTNKQVLQLAFKTFIDHGFEIEVDVSYHSSGIDTIDFQVFYIVAIEYRDIVKDF